MVTTVAAGLLARRLEVDSDLRRLLPQGHRVVRGLDDIERTFGTTGSVNVVIKDGPIEARHAFTDAVAERLQGHPLLENVDYRLPSNFFSEHALYYLSDAEMESLDILVNNAGVTGDNLLMRLSDEDWDRVVDTNLKGAFNTIRAASRGMMRRRHGRIINITSVVGVMGNAGQANYAASKAGLIGLTKSVAKELASRNILCNAIAPGFIESEMTAVLGDATRDAMLGRIALGRFGTGEEIASVVRFLAGPGAAYITGQVIIVDGGMVI